MSNFETALKQSFTTKKELREWFKNNHLKEKEIYIKFYNKSSGVTSVDYSEALDEALCVGWIDSVVKKVTPDDDSRYQRFTPRRENSYWSYRNITKMEVLISKGLVLPNGKEVFENRPTKDKDEVYQQENPTLSKDFKQQIKLKTSQEGYDFYKDQSESYHKRVAKYVMSPKREHTRVNRVEELIVSLNSQTNIFKRIKNVHI
ncbi:hypothetical protein DLAC_00230 [Tieghemostelium lacteum]|uniref:Bacteriocin-protection protein, YdeI/OmpD-associated family n=1 Tax=Tieghemostelium lacteum TaxID=361077 RepID=A0A152A9M9_TIELA|nr:hypothetical protein DLAC_00230 [Tieghemostelium lacteum]|eukprot:KYR02767.1 hypothetical protein DLAC_00230 [Tieghemostelium lacteum]